MAVFATRLLVEIFHSLPLIVIPVMDLLFCSVVLRSRLVRRIWVGMLLNLYSIQGCYVALPSQQESS